MCIRYILTPLLLLLDFTSTKAPVNAFAYLAATKNVRDIWVSTSIFDNPGVCFLPTRTGSSSLNFRDHDDSDTDHLLVNRRPDVKLPSTVESNLPKTSGVNVQLLGAIILSQVILIGMSTLITGAIQHFTVGVDNLSELFASYHWGLGNDYHDLFYLTPITVRVAAGIVASLPMILCSGFVEHSENVELNTIQIDTMRMVMVLLGRRWHAGNSERTTILPEVTTSRQQALVASACIASLVGACEEIVFRGQIPATFDQVFHSTILASIAQALLFGIAHKQHASSRQGNANTWIGVLQIVNGLWYSFVYIFMGGDLLPCIIAHALYDTKVIYETWTTTNNQLDYVDAMSSTVGHLTPAETKELQTIRMSDKIYHDLLRLFYSFDKEHRGSLSKSDTMKALAYGNLLDLNKSGQSNMSKTNVDSMFEKIVQQCENENNIILKENAENRLRFPGFVRLIRDISNQATNENQNSPVHYPLSMPV